MCNQPTSNTPITETPELWCAHCGLHLDVVIQDFTWKTISKKVVWGTCRNENCPMNDATLNPDELSDPAILGKYGATASFDVFSGIVLQVVDQQMGNQIAWLMMHATPDEIAAFEQYTAHHSGDYDYAQMVAAFCEGISPAPDYSDVCQGYHLEGR